MAISNFPVSSSETVLSFPNSSPTAPQKILPIPPVENDETYSLQVSSQLEKLIRRRVKRVAPESQNISPLMTAAYLHEALIQEKKYNFLQPQSSVLQDIKDILKLYPNLNNSDRRLAGGLLLEITRYFQTSLPPSGTLQTLQQQIQGEFDRMKQTIEPNIHFIWTGLLSEKIKSNIGIFLKINPLPTTGTNQRPPLSFYLSYDPRGYMAYLLKTYLYRMAQADVSGLPIGPSRDKHYQQTVLKLQNEAYAYIRLAKTAEAFNHRAIDFMVWRLGGNEAFLNEELNKAKRSFSEFKDDMDQKHGKDRLKLLHLDTLIHDTHPLQEYYLQEIWLRGNLASASDMGRAVLLSHYGGTYIDADLSPLLEDNIFDTHAIETEINAKLAGNSLNTWTLIMQAAKIQSVHNFIASKDPSIASLANEAVFHKLHEWGKEIPEITDQVANYIKQVKATPEKYAQGSTVDICRFFKPVEQPKILPAGLAMQQRPSSLGYDNSVLHGKKGAMAFPRYVQLVQERYEELRRGGLFWDLSIPRDMNNNSQLKERYGAYYRLDGLQIGAAATGKITGPIVLAQAVTGPLNGIVNQTLLEKFKSYLPPSGIFYSRPLFVVPRLLQFETPEELHSSWRAQAIPQRSNLFQPSKKYDKQIILQLDDSVNSRRAVRYLNNRHPHSTLLVVGNNDFSRQDGSTFSGLTSEEWGVRARVILVGTFRNQQMTLGGKSARDLTLMIKKLAETRENISSSSWLDWILGRPRHSLARIKVVGWSTETEEIVSTVGENSGIRKFSTQLLENLQKENVSAESLKSYDGPVEIDVLGRTWVTNSQSGEVEHHSPMLRFLVKMERNQAVIQPVPFADMEEWDVLSQAPALSVGKAERRAIVLIVPEIVLKTNAPTEFQAAVKALREKHPEVEVYAINEKENEGQWKFDPTIQEDGWKENWRVLKTPLNGKYQKVELLGHGKNAQIGHMSYDRAAQAFSKLMGKVTEIGHLSILACSTALEFGIALQTQLAGNGDCMVEEITLSESPLSIELNSSPGRRLYWENNSPVKKWQIKLLPTGVLEILRYRPTSDQIVSLPENPKLSAGPFHYARQLQEQTEAKQKVYAAMETLNHLGKQSEAKAALLSNKSGAQVALWDQLKGENGRYFLPVIHVPDGSSQNVEITSEKIKDIQAAQATLSIGYEYLKSYLDINARGDLIVKLGEGGEVNSMNGAFFSMALLGYLNTQDRRISSSTLSVYWNLGGMAAAVAGDGVELGKTLHQILVPGGAMERSLQTLGNIFHTANTAFMAGTLALDIYEWTQTKDPVKRLGIEIGLAFNSATLLLQGGTTMVNWMMPAAAAGTAGAFGSLAVPLAGLGFGFSELARQIMRNNIKLHSLLEYCKEAQKAYEAGGMENRNGLLVPNPAAVITKLDFKSGKVTFGSQQMAKSQYSGWYAPHLIYNFENHDWQRFGLREVLGAAQETSLDVSTAWTLVPGTPHIHIDYDYVNIAPKISSQEDALVKILQRTGAFVAWNSNKTLGAGFTSKRGLVYRPLTMNLVLDKRSRGILFPPEVNENMSYQAVGGGGNYSFSGLHAGIKLKIQDDLSAGPASYFLQVPGAKVLENEEVLIDQEILVLKDRNKNPIRIDISGLHPNSKISVEGTIASWNINAAKSRIRTLDLRTDTSLEVETYLRKMASQGRTEEVVSLIQGELPAAPKANVREEAIYQHQLKMAEILSIHTAYDAKNFRIIAPAENYPTPKSALLEGNQILAPWIGTKLVGVTETHSVFFNSITQLLWRTDRLTNQVLEPRYQLTFANSESRVEGFSQNDNSFRLRVPSTSSKSELSFSYVFKEGALWLEAVGGLNSDQLRNFNHLFFRETPQLDFQLAMRDALFLETRTSNLPTPKIAQWLRVQGTGRRPRRFLISFEHRRVIPISLLANSFVIKGMWGETTWINFDDSKPLGTEAGAPRDDFKVVASWEIPQPKKSCELPSRTEGREKCFFNESPVSRQDKSSGGWRLLLQLPQGAKICDVPGMPVKSSALTFVISTEGKRLENPFDSATLRNVADGKKGKLIPHLGIFYFVSEEGRMFMVNPDGSSTAIQSEERP